LRHLLIAKLGFASRFKRGAGPLIKEVFCVRGIRFGDSFVFNATMRRNARAFVNTGKL
jgi:hypothetical protein